MDFYQTDCDLSNPSGQLVVECENNNISKTKHNPTVDAKDMATGALLAPPNSTLLSLAEFSLLSHFFFFFWSGLVAFCCFKGIFSITYNFVP
jgi:hypothetical protein